MGHSNVACEELVALAESPFYGELKCCPFIKKKTFVQLPCSVLFAESDGMEWTWTASLE